MNLNGKANINGTVTTCAGLDSKLDLHVNEATVEGGPTSLQDFKHCDRCSAHDVQFISSNQNSPYSYVSGQALLIGPLGIMVRIILHGQKYMYCTFKLKKKTKYQWCIKTNPSQHQHC